MSWLPPDSCYDGYSLKLLGRTPQAEKEYMQSILKQEGFPASAINDEKLIAKCFQTVSGLLSLIRNHSQNQIEELEAYYKEEGIVSGITPLDLELVYQVFLFLLNELRIIKTIVYTLALKDLVRYLYNRLKKREGKKTSFKKDRIPETTVINIINILTFSDFLANIKEISRRHPDFEESEEE